MGRTRLAKATVVELTKRIQLAKERKRILEKYFYDLRKQYSEGRISYAQYVEIIYKHTDGRTILEWIRYYDEYIQDCENRLRKEKRVVIARQSVFVLFIVGLVSVLLFTTFNLQPTFIGFIIQEQEFTQQINFETTESTNYEWNLENLGRLDSVKLSGILEGNGDAKVYLDDKLILDTSNIQKSKITGGAIAGIESEKSIFDFFKKIFGRLTGRIAEEETNQLYSEINEAVPQEDSSPSQEEPSSSEKEVIKNITEQTPSINKSYSELNGSEVPPEDSSPSLEELPPSEENITETVNESVVDKKTKKEKEVTIKEFKDLCEETCDLGELNLIKSSYILRIEISNAKLKLDNIKYKISEGAIPEKVAENITEKIPENMTEINVTTIGDLTEENATIITTQYGAVLNMPVKWKKHITAKEIGIVKIKIPKESENVVIKKIKEETEQDITSAASITGQVSSEEGEPFILKLFRNVFSRLTGRVVEEEPSDMEISVEIDDSRAEYEAEYETPAPYSIEEDIPKGKRVKVVGPENIHYENVLAFTELTNEVSEDKIRLYRTTDGVREQTLFTAYDNNENGLIDYIEWVVPSLSNQSYELEIIIVDAEHLNPGKNFVANIYEQVNQTDNITYTIPKNHYARAYFERNLTNENLIDIYVLNNGPATIEIYEKDSSVVVGEIDIEEEGLYFIDLNFEGSQSVFDLKSIGNDVVYDYIHDAIAVADSAFAFATTPIDYESGTTTVTGTYALTGASTVAADITVKINSGATITDSCGANPIKLTSCDIPVISKAELSDCCTCNAGTGYVAQCSCARNDNGDIIWGVAACPGMSGTTTYITLSSIGGPTITANLGISAPADNTPPYFTQIPENVSGNYLTTNVNAQFVATDETSFSMIFINDTSNFTMTNSTKTLTNKTPLFADSYALNVTINDSSNNINWTIFTVAVAKIVPTGTLTNNETWTETYPTELIIGLSQSNSGSDDLTYVVYRDGVSKSTGETVSLAVGDYDYILNTTGGYNYTANVSMDTKTLAISQNADVCGVEFNETSGLEYPRTFMVWSNCSTANYLVRNVTVIGNNTEQSLPVSAYNFSTNRTDTFNYSDYYGEREFRIVDTTSPTWSGNQTNNTLAGGFTTFAIQYDDTSALDANGGYIFSTNNSGVWDNESLVLWISTPEWANVTKVLPADVGNRTDYRWFANDSAGNVNNSDVFYVVTTSANSPPVIWNVSEIPAVTLTDGPGATYVVVNFSVLDENGVGNLVNSSAMINFTKASEELRMNSSCAFKEASGNYANYTCNVTMWWWDATGADWAVYANITDAESNLAINDTNTFTVNTLTGFVVSPSELTFTSLLAGSTNQTPSDYFVLNNTGNVDITSDNVQVNATDLFGETNPGQALWAGNFSASTLTGGNIECNITASATQMVNMSLTGVVGSVLSAGNFTKSDGTGQENLYFCLRQVGLELSEQQYSTDQLGAWTIKVVTLLVAVIPARRKRKQKSKKKQKKKNVEDDKLLEALNLIADELKESYSLNKEEIIKVIIERLKKKYKINRKEIVEIIRENKELIIPITIFSKELGALESLTKYMKENLNMNYKEIAEELNRDERTIWTAYKKASEKQKATREIKETKIFLPISIFKNEKLTILESIILYLKEKGMKYIEIAKLLDRDQRNIWTIYSRVIKKQSNNI